MNGYGVNWYAVVAGVVFDSCSPGLGISQQLIKGCSYRLLAGGVGWHWGVGWWVK